MLVCLLLVACGGGDGGGGADGRVPTVSQVELGTGRTSFIPLPGNIELVMGPQGGWHLDLTLRLWSDDPGGLVLRYEVRRDGESEPVSAPTTYVVEAARLIAEGDHWLRLGDRAVLAIAGPDEIVGDAVVLEVDVNGLVDSRSAAVIDAEP